MRIISRNAHKLWVGVTASLALAGASYGSDLKNTASAATDLCLNLYKAVSAAGQKNVVISPLSLVEALGMATNGAEGETKTQLMNLLGDMEVSELNATLLQFREQLNEYAGKSNDAFVFNSANSLWANSNPNFQFNYTDDFKEIAEGYYGAGVFAMDFLGKHSLDGREVDFAAVVSDWAEKQTNGKIKNLIEKIDPDAVAILVNAVYAKGRFLNHFYEVTEGTFTDSSGTSHEVSLLTKQERRLNFYEDDKVKAYSMEIGDPSLGVSAKGRVSAKEIVLDIIVAKEELSRFVRTFDRNYYDKIIKGFTPKPIELSIPAAVIAPEKSLALKEIFKAAPFNLVAPFDPNAADFSRLGTVNQRGLYIDQIWHKGFYEITPYGFEAAAATGVVVVATSAEAPVEWRKEIVDKPALHIVRHLDSGFPLFIAEIGTAKKYNEAEAIGLIKKGAENGNSVIFTYKDGTSLQVGVANGRYGIVRMKNSEVVETIETLGN